MRNTLIITCELILILFAFYVWTVSNNPIIDLGVLFLCGGMIGVLERFIST